MNHHDRSALSALFLSLLLAGCGADVTGPGGPQDATIRVDGDASVADAPDALLREVPLYCRPHRECQLGQCAFLTRECLLDTAEILERCSRRGATTDLALCTCEQEMQSPACRAIYDRIGECLQTQCR